MRRVPYGVALMAVALCALAPAAGHAQALREQCAAAAQLDVQQFCRDVADAAAIMQPRIGIGMTGGNPVPGTASTLGMRLRSTPRVSIGIRTAAARVSAPPIQHVGQGGDVGFTAGSLSIDAGAGVFHGLRLLPTVGGFGSVDLLASAGIAPLPSGTDFGGTRTTWAVGARVGVLRESFTAPAVSVSGMYRSLGSFEWGDRDLNRRDAHLRLSGYRVTSLRGTVGKRLFGVGLTGGVGHDRYRADVTARIRETEPPGLLEIRENGLSDSRNSVFGNAALTFLILNLSAEVGWQQGGDAGADGSRKLERGGLFGGLAARLAI